MTARAQQLNPDDYIFPVQEVAGLFSANFGEMRPNHFHSGIDIKTDGVTGKPVVAVADGYISRIAVTPRRIRTGHLYHPSQRYDLRLRTPLRIPQRHREVCARGALTRTRRNSINLYPSADKFPLRQGEEFAKSGNTGASAGRTSTSRSATPAPNARSTPSRRG